MLGLQNDEIHLAEHKVGLLASGDAAMEPFKTLVQLSQSLLEQVSNMQRQQELMQQQLHLQQQQLNLLRIEKGLLLKEDHKN